jgi:hypothetical protein
VSDRPLGLLLFLPVPIVLALFTRAPFGLGASLLLGVALMLSHRLYARPFALARAARRCLWCGAAAREGPELELREPFGPTRWRTCSDAHADRLGRTLAWAGRHALFLRLGILGTLVAFLAVAALIAARTPGGFTAASGHLGPLAFADASALFRLGIAVTVLPLGWLASRTVAPEALPLAVPFPVHIQALIGTVWVLWLFRVVGIAWLAQGGLLLLARLAS